MSSIVKDVKAKIENGLVDGDLTLADIFGEETVEYFEKAEAMDEDSLFDLN